MSAKRVRVLITLLIVLSMVIAACGDAGAPATEGAPAETDGASPAAEAEAPAADTGEGALPAEGANVDLRIAWWGSQDRHDRTIEVIKMFQEESPNIAITYEFAAFGDYWTKLTTQAAGGNLPCVIQQDYAYLAEWVSRDLHLPLDEYVADNRLDLTNVPENQIAGGKIDGKLYAVNLGTNSQAFTYDPALFEEAGVEEPSVDWTWQDFEQIATQIHEALDIYGMGSGLADSQVFKVWLKQHGQWLYNDEGTALGYEDDALFTEFFQMILRLQEAGVIPSRESDVARGEVTVEQQYIVSEEAAMAYFWSNQIVAVSTAAGERPLEMMLLPGLDSPDAVQGNYLKPSQFFSVTSGCEHPEEAVKFIDFFTNSVEANKVLLAERGVPISTEVRAALEPELGPAQQEMFEYISLVEEHSSPIDPPDPAGHTEVTSDAYTPVIDQILYGQLSPEDGAAQFREQANAILSQGQ